MLSARGVPVAARGACGVASSSCSVDVARAFVGKRTPYRTPDMREYSCHLTFNVYLYLIALLHKYKLPFQITTSKD
ncbi:hypothetical protein PoB_005754500 [Plakobranchus ocellatus]|uniref:Secreted protein n=1 Tax=Plakobranchus ocellatus TaxID=259542 RepID=A0AAV4CGZ2_9GAST|nr:hypothetical protein PoB_005754500 [Plakobranchus ocellatus]